uniref:Uncharacterized protein n=1 Tax=Ditylenchus dipsaci TaxID=166011 RepID=A0A915DMT2_9BILA
MSDEVFEKLVRVLNTYSGRDKAMRTIYFGLVLVSTRINRAALAKHVLALASNKKIPGDLEHSTDVQDTCLSSVITLLFGANSLAEFVAWLSDARILKFDASRWFRYCLYLYFGAICVEFFDGKLTNALRKTAAQEAEGNMKP